ncbi:MAG TPA: hypothetical protein VMT00_09265, partial [Thermoanaerobaculia bacterium]|nr:hypothetical protein [Thermoanaerobaculia bacterium]
MIFISIDIPVIATFAYFFFVLGLRRQGFPPRESHAIIWREPAWWLWWYPASLRREGNVWDRLPGTVRGLRWSIVAFLASMLFCWTIFAYIGDDYIRDGHPGEYGVGALIQFAIIVVTVVAWALFTVLARRELRRKGLFEEDVNRVMMSVPPSRTGFWARPHIAAILAPAAKEISRGTGSPHEQLQTILRQGDELTGSLRPLGAQAAVAARQLVASIDALDREIAGLARNLEPGEEERLAGKIEALSASSTSAETSAPMRGLLEKQLELIRDLAERMEAAKEKKGRRVEMLRTLALHVSSLRARQTPTPSELREISDDVKALCADIERQAAATEPTVPDVDSMSTVERD